MTGKVDNLIAVMYFILPYPTMGRTCANFDICNAFIWFLPFPLISRTSWGFWKCSCLYIFQIYFPRPQWSSTFQVWWTLSEWSTVSPSTTIRPREWPPCLWKWPIRWSQPASITSCTTLARSGTTRGKSSWTFVLLVCFFLGLLSPPNLLN